MNRYPAYKPSGIQWIGDIPEHWDIATLRRITFEHKQGFYSIDGYVDDGCKLIRISDLDNNGKINYATAPSTNISQEEYEIFGLKRGDFIFPRTGSVGLLGFVQEEIEAVFASYLIRFRFKNCNDHFLKYYFISYSFINGIYADLHGGVNQNIHAENIKNQILPIPPPPEQTAIANFLDRKIAEIDQIIADKEKLIELYEEEKKALINEAVTKGIDPNVKMKDSGIEWLGEIPEHWEVMRMKNIGKVSQGLQIPISERLLEPYKGSYKYITIQTLNFSNSTQYYVTNVSQNVICWEDDILVARTGATGQIITNVHGAFHNNFFKFSYDRSIVDKWYLFHYLKTPRINEYLLMAAGTTTIPDLNHGDFYNTPFLLPIKEEQIKIVNHIETELEKIESKTKNTRKEIDLLKEYRQALIFEAVTGKIDVRELQ